MRISVFVLLKDMGLVQKTSKRKASVPLYSV